MAKRNSVSSATAVSVGTPRVNEKTLDSTTYLDHQDSTDRTLKPRPWLVKTTPWSALVNHQYKGSGTNEDPYVVTWLPKGPDETVVDYENPMTYGFWYKWTITILGEFHFPVRRSVEQDRLRTGLCRRRAPPFQRVKHTWCGENRVKEWQER